MLTVNQIEFVASEEEQFVCELQAPDRLPLVIPERNMEWTPFLRQPVNL
jgi:hypothetical protein